MNKRSTFLNKNGWAMGIKIFLFAFIICSFCNAAMIGDFSPMKVGNIWVYSCIQTTGAQPTEYEYFNRTIKILSMTQHGDSLFYSIIDSTPNNPVTKKYLEINDSNFLYDTSSKNYGPPEDFFKFHQLPDSILQKVIFLSQGLYSYSVDTVINNCGGIIFCNSSYNWQWIQNYGLFSYSDLYGYAGTSGETKFTLISFNNQPVGTPTKIIGQNTNLLYGDRIVFADDRNQIHFRGLSAADRLNIQVYDCRGKLLFSSRQLPGSFVLNTSRFSRGAYILRYQVNNETWKHFSFVRN